MNIYQIIPHFGLKRQYAKLKEELLDASDLALSSGQLVDGPFVYEFEAWLRNRTGCKYAVTVHSGTQALEILAKCEVHNFSDLFHVSPTVLLPNLTYVATLNAFLTSGYKVELADTDQNGLMIRTKETHTTEPFYYYCNVGLYGAPPNDLQDHEAYNSGRDNYFIDGAQHWLIERASNIGIGMAISFDPTKNLPSSGNGGAIVTDDGDVYSFACAYKNNGNKFNNTIVGTNSKMSEQDCAQILVRTKHLDYWQRRRKKIREYYISRLKDLPIRLLSKDFETHADQKFVIYTEHRDDLLQFLGEVGIECKIHYAKTLSQLPITAAMKKPDFLSVSVMLTRGLLSLPIYPELTDVEVELIASKVCEFFAKTT